MLPKTKSLRIMRGNDVDMLIRIKYRSGAPFDLSKAQLVFVAKVNANDEPVLRLATDTGGIVLTEEGFAKLTIPRSATAGTAWRYAEYNLHLITADGKTKTVLKGSLEVEPNVE